MDCPRTNAPKSERLYSERSPFAAGFLAFPTELPLCPRCVARGDEWNGVVMLSVVDHEEATRGRRFIEPETLQHSRRTAGENGRSSLLQNSPLRSLTVAARKRATDSQQVAEPRRGALWAGERSFGEFCRWLGRSAHIPAMSAWGWPVVCARGCGAAYCFAAGS